MKLIEFYPYYAGYKASAIFPETEGFFSTARHDEVSGKMV
jgi:hypothetical protein